jgi:hypothetical protein
LRKFLALLIVAAMILCFSSPSRAQNGNTITIIFPGIPTGTCSPFSYAINNTNGDLYNCFQGTWNEVTGGGGGGGSPGSPTYSTQYNAGGGNFGGVGPGTAGEVLESNGAGQAPSFQDPIVSGPTAIGSAPSGTNPVFIATWDGTDIRVPITSDTTPGASDYALEVRPVGTVPVSGTFWQATQPVSNAGTFAVQAAQSGTWTVTGSGGTFPVTQSTSPWIVAGGGTAGTPGTAVLTVQGVGSGTPVPVSGTFYQATQPVSCATAATCPSLVTGDAASGTAVAGNPVLTGGSDGTDARTFLTDNTGQQKVLIENTPAVTGSGVFEVGPTTSANTVSNPFFFEVGNGTNSAGLNGSSYTSTYGLNANILGLDGAVFSATNALFGQITDGTHAMGAMTTYGSTPSGYALPVNAYITSLPSLVIATNNAQCALTTCATQTAALPESSSTYAGGAFRNAAVTTAVEVGSTAAHNVYGWVVYNPNASLCVLNFYNGSPTLGSSTPVWGIPLAATATANVAPGSVAFFNVATSLYIAAETADGGGSTCSTGMIVYLSYE